MESRRRWPTVLFGAVPATILLFPAGIGILFGFFFAFKSLGALIFLTGALGWVGTIGLWSAARTPGVIGRRTAWALGLGISSAVSFAALKLFDDGLAEPLRLFPTAMLVGPVVVALVHLNRYRHAPRPAPSRAAPAEVEPAQEHAVVTIASEPDMSAPGSGTPVGEPRPSGREPGSAERDPMQLALKAILFVEVAGALLLAPVMLSNEGLGKLFTVFCVFPFVLGFLLTAAWSFATRRALRALSVAVFTVPFVMPALIVFVAGAAGRPAVMKYAVFAAAALPLITCLALPHQVARFLPGFLVRSRFVNVAVVVLLGLMAAPWAWYLARASRWTSGEIDDVVFFFAMWHSGVSIAVGVVAFLFGYTTLFQQRDRSNTRLRAAQMGLSVVLLALAVPTAAGILLILGAASVG